MFDVITIGSATRDVFLVSDKFIALKSRKFPTGAGECVALGSKIDVDELILTTGGGATNAAATLASLGFHTATMTRIGEDSTGKDIIDDLSHFGVSTHFVRMVRGGQSAISVLLTMKDGERTALVYRGVSASFDARDVHWEGCKQAKWIYLTSLAGNLALSRKVIRHAKECRVKVMWNPGHGELKAGLKTLASLIKDVDVLNMNLEEAKLLTGKRTVSAMFKELHTPSMIRLITDGTNGAYAWRDKKILHAGTTGVKALSRTGAGDAFGAGFLAGLMRSLPLEPPLRRSGEGVKYALAIATLNAESVIKQHGAKNGILTKWPSPLTIRQIKISLP